MSASVGFSFVKPTDDALTHVADNMRDLDVAEIWASHNHTPIDALRLGVESSRYSAVVCYDDIPCAVFGLVIGSIVTSAGSPWMLGTNDVTLDKRGFIKESKILLSEMQDVCGDLVNYVHSNNTPSIVYLRHLGFIIDSPAPYGANAELFHKFYLTR
jgi:hypothetical protein